MNINCVMFILVKVKKALVNSMGLSLWFLLCFPSVSLSHEATRLSSF